MNSVLKPITNYKLLINADTLSKLQNIDKSMRKKIKQILLDFISGEWEEWNPNNVTNFNLYKEREGDGELFTLYIPELKSCFIWKRVWSVDLLSRIEYPTGTFERDSSVTRAYAPHIVVNFVDRDAPPKFKIAHNNKFYEQYNSISQDFYNITPHDQLSYREELYLLGKNVIDDLLKGIQQGLPLQMSDEQAEVLQNRGPILVSGEAGSGKTIIITHWLMINHLRHTQTESYKHPVSQLFVTFSNRLRNNARGNFLTMLPKDFSSNDTHFLTYSELIRDIAKEAGILNQFEIEKEMTFEKYMKNYAKKFVPPKIDPVLLWDEMRSVIKGRSTEAQTFIDLPTYEKLSEKREQCKTPKKYRKDYYNAAQKYQNYILEHGIWDELDLVKACIPHLDTAKKFDNIACDEVQDLAPIEIRLLTKLIKNNDISKLFLTGDTAQVINPSGFHWSQVKGYLGENFPVKQISDVFYLERNYRSCKEIVDLVNSVLMVRSKIINDPVSKLIQTPSIKKHVLPMILSGKENNLVEMLNDIKSDPDKRLILTKTDEEKQKLLKKLGDAKNNNTILTIEEAKGLEYNGSLLWNFFIPRHPEITQNDWERVFIPQKRDKLMEEIKDGLNPYGLTYEFNLLHVGLTRSRFLLYCFDSEKNKQMILPLIGDEVEDKVTQGDFNVFKTHWETPKPSGDEWYKAGQRLLERDTEQAHRFFKLASKAYADKDEFIKAAESQELAEDYDSAAGLYKNANDKENELRVLGKKYKNLGKHEEAGNMFIKLGSLQFSSGNKNRASLSYEAAKESFYKAKKFELASEAAFKTADCLPSENHIEKAIKYQVSVDYFKEHSDIDSAIHARERAISEAKRGRQSGSNFIQGQHIDAWISKRYYEIAEDEENRKNSKEGASAAKKSANMLDQLIESDEFKSLPNKQKYYRDKIEALDLCIELYIKSNQIVKASDSQEQLFNLVSPEGNIREIQEWWSKYAELYFDQEEIDQFADTIMQLSKILERRRQFGMALSSLREGIKKIKTIENVPRKPLIRILDKYINIAESNDEWDDLAFAHKIYADLYEIEFDFVEAWNHLKEVGKACINAGKIQSEDHFKHGIEILTKSVSAVEVGKNCFFEIILDGYSKNPKLYDYLENWLKESARNFAQDFDLSIKLLNSYLERDVLEEINRLSKKINEAKNSESKKDLNSKLLITYDSKGWVETCLGFVYLEHAKIAQLNELEDKAQDWFNKALHSFEKSKNTDAENLIKRHIR